MPSSNYVCDKCWHGFTHMESISARERHRKPGVSQVSVQEGLTGLLGGLREDGEEGLGV